MTEEFHAMVVIDSHELVVLFLGNLMEIDSPLMTAVRR